MVHIDYADGTSAWLTDEQLKEKHPEIYAKLRVPVPYADYGRKLRDLRVKNDFSLKELADLLRMPVSELSAIETGKVVPSQEVVDFYGTLKQRVI
jgi:ribosome-binding protein aMBF1 (putative translation factor)